MTCPDRNFKYVVTAISHDVAFSVISFTYCCSGGSKARKDCFSKPEVTCLVSENGGQVGKLRASGLYATLEHLTS